MNVIAIYEPLHNQRVSAFLILGDDKALLLDTCIGIQNVREVVDELTDLPVTVLNSHDHFDHIGGNSYFDEVWYYNTPGTVEGLTEEPDEIILNEIYSREKGLYPIIKVLGLTFYENIQRKAPTGTVDDEQIIDIGGRKLEVIHTPGQDPSCLMLLDRENKLMFTGDMFYYGYMFCSTDGASLPEYVINIRKAANIAKENGIEKLYVSHDKCVIDTEILYQFADWLEILEKGEITENKQDDVIRVYYMRDKLCIELLDEDPCVTQNDTVITEIPDKDPGSTQNDTAITEKPDKDPDSKQNNTVIIIIIIISAVLAVVCIAVILIVRKKSSRKE